MGVKWGFVAWLLTAISKYNFFFKIDLTIIKHVLPVNKSSVVFLLLYSWKSYRIFTSTKIYNNNNSTNYYYS